MQNISGNPYFRCRVPCFTPTEGTEGDEQTKPSLVLRTLFIALGTLCIIGGIYSLVNNSMFLYANAIGTSSLLLGTALFILGLFVSQYRAANPPEDNEDNNGETPLELNTHSNTENTSQGTVIGNPFSPQTNYRNLPLNIHNLNQDIYGVINMTTTLRFNSPGSITSLNEGELYALLFITPQRPQHGRFEFNIPDTFGTDVIWAFYLLNQGREHEFTFRPNGSGTALVQMNAVEFLTLINEQHSDWDGLLDFYQAVSEGRIAREDCIAQDFPENVRIALPLLQGVREKINRLLQARERTRSG